MLSSFLTVLIPLVIITDPLGNLPFFLIFTESHTVSEQRRTAAVAASTAFFILAFFALTGDFILRFFSISLPAFQLAGGFIFFVYALQMLNLIPSGIKTSEEEEMEGVAKENAAMVPIATPLLAGPGAITAVVVRQQTTDDPLNIILLLSAIFTCCLIIFLVFFFGQKINRFMGVGGIRVVTRLLGLLLAVIAVQFMVNGVLRVRG